MGKLLSEVWDKRYGGNGILIGFIYQNLLVSNPRQIKDHQIYLSVPHLLPSAVLFPMLFVARNVKCISLDIT